MSLGLKRKFMKKTSLFIALLLLLSACIEEITRNRPNNVPESAFYIGGIDGGDWVDTIRNGYSMTYFVYSEFEGEPLDTCIIVAKDEVELKGLMSRVSGYNGVELGFYTSEISFKHRFFNPYKIIKYKSGLPF